MKKIKVLESVRGLAALYIFLAHFSISHGFANGKFGIWARFGQEAVMLFFLLSGFVIFYSFQKHLDQSFGEYFRRRAVRIFPIYFLALAVSYVVVCQTQGVWLSPKPAELLGNVFMLQDLGRGKPGVWFGTYYGNIALWSLAYEWWFYMLFYPINRKVEASKQRTVAALIALVGFITYVIFPNQISLYLNYFIIWWVGVELARVYVTGSKPTYSNMEGSINLLTFFTGLYFFNIIYVQKISHKGIKWGLHPLLEFRHFAFALIMVVVAVMLPRKGWQILNRCLAPFALLAPISYGLYLLHYPLGGCSKDTKYLAALLPQPLQLLGYVVIVLAASCFAELVLQKWANKAFRRSPKLV